MSMKLWVGRFLLCMLAWGGLIAQAHAHGAVADPIARQYYCKKNENPWGGTINNPGCRAAFEKSGAYPFDQWNEVSKNVVPLNDPQAIKRAIPNGTLCAAGDAKKAGLDVPQSAGWPKTTVTAGAPYTLKWDANVPHDPSWSTVYITKPGVPLDRPLHWEDLEILKAREDLPGAVPGKPYDQYQIQVQLPAGRTGPAILYSIWQRDDSAGEGFYNCSDIDFGGGTPGFPWIDERQYVEQGFAPKVGELVHFRVFNTKVKSGAEVVDINLPVTAQNANQHVWARELATQLNTQHASYVQIGVRHGDAIQYDASHVPQNRVWLKHGYRSAMSIVDGSVPVPPVARIDAPDTVDSDANVTFSGAGSSGIGLTYTWELAGFTPDRPAATTNPSVTAKAPHNTNPVPTAYATYLTVKDSRGQTSPKVMKTIMVRPAQGGDKPPRWDRTKVGTYESGTAVTGLDNEVWYCKPFPNGAWCKTPPNTSDDQWPYAPGSSAQAALPEAQRAWQRTKP